MRLFVLPSFEDLTRDEFFIASFHSKTSFSRYDKNTNTLVALGEHAYISSEQTLNTGVYKGRHLQITTTTVRLIHHNTMTAEWKVTDNDTIKCSWIGNQYIVIATHTKKVFCLHYNDMTTMGRFLVLDEKSMKANVTCVMEHNQQIFIGMDDRSLLVYAVHRDQLEERCQFVLSKTPSFICSFATQPLSSTHNLATSNDEVLFIGCVDGDLFYYHYTYNTTTPTYKLLFTRSLGTDTLYASFIRLRNMPYLVISSKYNYYLVSRKDPFRMMPINFVKSTILSSNSGSLFIYRSINHPDGHLQSTGIVRRDRMQSLFLFEW